MSIVEFLEARIAEDESVAKDRSSSAPIHYSGCYYYNYSLDANWFCDCDEDGQATARVLAECAAKRAIIGMHQPTLRTVEWFDDATGTGRAPTCPSCRPEDPTDWHPPIGMAGIRPEGFVASYTLAPCPTLRTLAAVYREHPEYDREWA